MTTTQICNQALSHLGEARITDYHEPSVLAEKCRVKFDQTRDALLRMHRWNFAEERVELAQLSDAPVFGYTFQYQLPADFLRMLELNGVEARMGEPRSYKIEGKRLLTNVSVAKVVYVRRVVDSTEFDPVFTDAFAYKLAADLAMTVTTSTSDRNSLLSLFAEFMRDAGWVDAVESKTRIIPAWTGSRSLQARFYGGRPYGRSI